MPSSAFFTSTPTGYGTTVRNIVTARNFFAQWPDGHIATGMWTDPHWTKATFYAWFRRCVLLKCGGAEYTEREAAMLRDGRKVNRYKQGIRHSGSGLLETARMQRRYPHVNCQTVEA